MRPLESIHQSLDALGRRQRGLIAARAGLLGGAGAGALLLVAAGALSAGAPAWTAGLLGGRGLLGAAVGLWRMRPTWVAAGDRLVQARAVEAVDPELRGRLVTAVDQGGLLAEELGEGAKPIPGVSKVLLERAARKAAERARAVPPERLYPEGPARQAGGLALGLLCLLLIGQWWMPVGPLAVLGLMFGRELPAAATAAAPGELAEERALVGDIVLRYIYPDFTGIEPFEVLNSDGTIHAPPGTVVEIRARTASTYQSAALQVDDGEAQEAALLHGRDVSARLVVERDGLWRFIFAEEERRIRSPDYRIVAEGDQPPAVVIERTLEARLPVDRPLGLRWSVQDDFGVARVVLEIVDPEGKVREVELRKPLEAPRELGGQIVASPRELGLKPGEKLKLRVVAMDQQAGGGSQRGQSQDMEVTITGAQSSGENLADHHRALRDAMVLILAEFLEERVPMEGSAQDMTRWVEGARVRFDALQQLQEAQWGDEQPVGIDTTLVNEVLEAAARLFRFSLTAWDPSTTRRITDQDLRTFDELYEAEIAALERGIYVLDSLLMRVALSAVVEQAERVAAEAEELSRMAESADAAQLLAQLDQLERLMAQLAQASSQLSESSLREFMNSRTDQLKSLMDEVRKAIQEGRMDDAREMIQQLAAQMQEMKESLQDRLQSGQQQENQLEETFEKTMKELESLEQAQRSLADRMRQAQEQHGQDVTEQIAMWEKLDGLMEAARAGADRAVKAADDGQGWRSGTIQWLDKLEAGVGRLGEAITARDVNRSLDESMELRTPITMSTRQVGDEKRRPRPASDPVPAGVGAAEKGVGEVARAAAEIEKILRQLEQRSGEEPEAVQQAARQLSAEQAQLRQRQQALEQQVQTIERNMPTADGSASRSLDQAGEAMERAEGALERGQGMAGEGHQRDAANRLRDTREQLNQQMQDYQQMQRAAQQMQQGKQEQGQGQEDQGEKEGQKAGSRIEIPRPEDFQTPEQYRQELLRGMEGEVPSEFEALKRRYFEDLVRQ